MKQSAVYALSIALLVLAGVIATRGEPATETEAEASRATSRDHTPAVLGPIQPMPSSLDIDPHRVAIGERLFHDERLSGDGTISCASCHDLSLGGADGRARSVGTDGAVGAMNAPTVFNTRFNFRQFWDGRAASLEDQIDGPLEHPDEMNSTWAHAIAVVAKDQTYRELFEEQYGGVIDKETIRDAIATYERSLITPNSRFDRFLLGDTDALDEAEHRGYALFLDVGCVTCHQGVNMGGNMFQVFGRMESYFPDEETVRDEDRGRFNITGRSEDMHKFKVPSLRNVALTAPYLHDGSSKSLAATVQIMARCELGVEFADEDVSDLVAFLESLTGEQPLDR